MIELNGHIEDNGDVMVDEDSGETLTIYRPAKSSTTSIAVTLK